MPASELPLPKLLHPILVKFRKIDTSATKYDRQAREPIGKAGRSQIYSLYGQISWKAAKFIPEEGGSEVTTDGYILFLRKDLVELGVDIEYNDQIIQIGERSAQRDVNLYVEMIQYRGHNPNYYGHTMVKAWFSDKDPVRHR